MNDKRDIGFKPFENENPKTLTPDQIKEFNEKGVLFPFDGLNKEEAQQHLEFVDRLMDETHRKGGNGYTINCKQAFLRSLYDVCLHPKILAVVGDLLGENYLVWATHYFSKEAGDTKRVVMHQDASYWPITPSRTVTVWLAVDDVDVENAAMQVIPGTHRKGLLPWKKAEDPAVLDQELTGIDELGDPVSICLKAGQFSLHSDLSAHGSEPNLSNRRRCGLTIRYAPSYVRPITEGWGSGAIHCSGEQVDHWTYLDRPEFDDIDGSIQHLDKRMANAAR